MIVLGRILAWLVVCLGWVAAQDQSTPAALRFSHQSPDAPLVDVLIDGRAVLQDMAFSDISHYVLLPPGRHEVRVFPHRRPGRGADGMAPAEDEEEGAERGRRGLEPVTRYVTVEAGRYYTAVLAGFYEPVVEASQRGHLSIAVDPTDAEIHVSGPRGYGSEHTGDQLLSDLQPGTYTVTASLEGFREAIYEAEVESRETTSVTITLQEGDGDPAEPGGAVRTAGDETGDGFQLQAFEDVLDAMPPASTARVRVIHAAPTSPALNVVADAPVEAVPGDAQTEDGSDEDDGDEVERDGARDAEADEADAEPVEIEIAESLSYPAASAYVAVPAGTLTLRFVVSGSDQAVLELQDVELQQGGIYTFFLTSDVTGSRPRVIPSLDAMIGRYGRLP